MDVISPESPEYAGCYDLYDILEKISYVNVTRQGFIGSAKNISIMGSNNQQVLYALDGVVLEGLGLKSSVLARIPLNSIEKIEIYTNGHARSRLANSRGILINLLTKTNKSPLPETGFGFEYHRHDTLKYNLSFDVSNEASGMLFYADRNTSSGYRENENYLGESIFAKLKMEFDRDASLEFTGMMFNEDRGLPGENNTPLHLWGDHLERISFSPRDKAEYDKQLGTLQYRSGRLNTKLFGSVDEEVRANYSLPESKIFRQNIMRGFYTAMDLPLGSVTGVEFRQNRYFDKDRITNSIIYKDRLTENTLFINTLNTYGRNSLSLGADMTSAQGYSKHFCPNMRFSSDLNDFIGVTAGASKNIRYPSPEETMFNDNLMLEKNYRYDAGLVLNIKPAVLKTLLFTSDYKNNIESSAFAGTTLNHNSAEIYRSRGIDTFFQTDFLKIKNTVSYTYVASRGRESGNLMAYSPKHKFNYALSYYGIEKTNLSISLCALSRQYVNNANAESLPGYALIDVSLSRKVLSSEIFLGIKNLADKRYQTTEGYPLPGKVYFAGVRIYFLN